MTEKSATHLEVTRDIVVAILANTEKQTITSGSAETVAKDVAVLVDTIFEAVKLKNRF